MKKTVRSAMLILLAMSSMAQAQNSSRREGVSTVKAPVMPGEGFQIGALYTNLTSATFKSKTTWQGREFSGESNGSAQLGMLGFRASYLRNINTQFFVEPGFFFQQRLNSSESEAMVKVYGFDGNVVMQSASGLNAYAGLIVSKLEFDSSEDSYDPALGAQVGVGYRTGTLSARVGYAAYGFQKNTEEDGVRTERSGNYSGFTTQVGVTF